MKSTIASLAALAVLASASPMSPVERGNIPSIKQLQCALISDVAAAVSKLTNGAANTYCSSYIAKTFTSTSTSTYTNYATTIATATLTATTATTVTVTGQTPTSTAVIYSNCGVPAYDKGTGQSYWFDNSGTYGTASTCGAKCTSDAQCLSFAVGPSTCILYTDTVANMNANSMSSYFFYDRACPVNSASSGSVSPAPTKRALLERAVAMPVQFIGLKPSKISSICSCVISSAYSITSIIPATATVFITNTVQTSATLTTDIITNTNTYTPSAVTVTVTSTAV